MLIDFSLQNFASFNSRQEFSMLASTSIKESDHCDSYSDINAFGIDRVLKSAAVFGANASGKTNLAAALGVFKSIVLNALSSLDSTRASLVMPFLLKKDPYDVPTEFEVSFIVAGNLYRYGIAISNKTIEEEWLYWTKASRETLLFHREGMRVKFNQRSFSEAKSFVKKENDFWIIEKTKEHVPFVSVLSQFNGEKSSVVTSWFEKINVISGISDKGYKDFTTELFLNDERFKIWALQLLKSMQIFDVKIREDEESIPPKNKKLDDDELNSALDALHVFLEKNKSKKKTIEIIKKGHDKDGNLYALPLDFESEGTQKLICMLGPLYETILKNEILIVDEFDNKFHTLLCKHIIKMHTKSNMGKSQLILTCHDTNLLTSDLFRRDQIWLVDKNEKNESELYSLVEYKEHYTRKGASYSNDYLKGKYGAIPLFDSVDSLKVALNG